MKEVTYTVHIESAEEGGFVAYFPALPGCHAQRETLEEVIAMAKDALAGYLDCLLSHGDPIPSENATSKPIGLLNGDAWVPAGNATIPPNQQVPMVGSVVEVRCLYAMPGSGSLYQPVYLGVRADVEKHECVT